MGEPPRSSSQLGPGLDVHRLPGDQRHRPGRRLVVPRRGIEQVVVASRSRARSSRPGSAGWGCGRCWPAPRTLPADLRRRLAAHPPPSRPCTSPGPPTGWGIPCRAWFPRCSTTCTRRPCGRSTGSCRRCCRCGSRCTCPGGIQLDTGSNVHSAQTTLTHLQLAGSLRT